jgi:serpin B
MFGGTSAAPRSSNYHGEENDVKRPMLSRRIALGLLLASILATGGCSLSEPAEARSSKPRRVVPRLSGDDPIADLAATLNPLVFGDAVEANVAYSPMSIALALGMLRAGTTGASARQLDAVFGSGVRLQDRLNAAERALGALAGDRKNASGETTRVIVDSACAVWAQQGVRWTPAYLDLLATTYGAGVRLSDFVGDPGGAKDAINDFVAERTRDKITDLMTPDAVTSATRLVLVNALYLKAPWWRPFPDAAPAMFRTPDGEVSAQTVSMSLSAIYQRADTYQTVTLPYAGNEVAMTIVLPDDDMLEPVGKRLATITSTVADSAASREVALALPLFALDSRVDLERVMRRAGVTAVFEASGQFREMSEDPSVDLYVSAMLHRATVTIDEQGTEAAAATAVVMDTTSAPAQPVEMVVDRPFYFMIHDTSVGMPLFVGRVTDPTKP